jgi:hypothetical protein
MSLNFILSFVLFHTAIAGLQAQQSFMHQRRTLRPNPSQAPMKHEIDVNEVRQVIAKLKASGEDWSSDEENYVLENINRYQLLLAIQRWEIRRKVLLPRGVKIEILVDYLLTELTGVKALPSYLDEVANSKSPTSFASRLKTQVAATSFKQYSFGRLEVDTNVDPVNLFIDDELVGPITKERRVVVLIEGGHSAVVKRSGLSDCSNTINIVAGQSHVVKCTFRTQ